MTKQGEIRYINTVNLLPLKSQRGYIKIVLVVFAIIIGLMIFPLKFPQFESQTDPKKCVAGSSPIDTQIIQLPVPTFIVTKDYGDQTISWGPPDEQKIEDYILIRPDVSSPQKASTKGWDIFGTNPLGDLAHTVPVGEDPQKPGYTLYYPTSAGEFYFGDESRHLANEEIVLFRKNDPSSVQPDEEKSLHLVDVYQRKGKYDDPSKGYVSEDLFSCVGEVQEPPKTTVTIPVQDVSQTKEQLQLEWFLFQKSGSGLWGVHCKPAVYLYPQRKQLVNVKVYPKGQLSFTDPPYDFDKGWTVEADLDGRLLNFTENLSPINQGYLYYESKIRDEEIEKPVKGWVVRFGKLEQLYNDVLPKLGLNRKEASDFKEYWLKTLPQSPYYFIGLMDKSQRDYLEPLEVTPSPDTSIRFSLYFEPLDQPIVVEEPEINTPERNGFTLVDWGGMIKLHPGTPFTCSQ